MDGSTLLGMRVRYWATGRWLEEAGCDSSTKGCSEHVAPKVRDAALLTHALLCSASDHGSVEGRRLSGLPVCPLPQGTSWASIKGVFECLLDDFFLHTGGARDAGVLALHCIISSFPLGKVPPPHLIQL
jgi:hypothetical protein